MAKKRRQHGAAFKAKVALEALKMQATVQQIAVRFGVHPQQVTRWKRQALEVWFRIVYETPEGGKFGFAVWVAVHVKEREAEEGSGAGAPTLPSAAPLLTTEG